jgi:hypothetical protein
LNADVVAGGAIRVGDQVEDLGPTEHSLTDS